MTGLAQLRAGVVSAALIGVAVSAPADTPVWREDFRLIPEGWEVRGKPGTDETRFSVPDSTLPDGGLLELEADDSSATLLTKLDSIDLRTAPILRWRWRVTRLPPGADGRNKDRDDQAIAIYVTDGGRFRQHSIAYRWETETPVGTAGWAKYMGGFVQVRWFCLRNRADAERGTFFTEERNVADDFRAAYGFIPKKPVIGIASNSQYTGSKAAAQLDWIELMPRVPVLAPAHGSSTDGASAE